MRVIVLDGTWFVGRVISEALVRAGHRVWEGARFDGETVVASADGGTATAQLPDMVGNTVPAEGQRCTAVAGKRFRRGELEQPLVAGERDADTEKAEVAEGLRSLAEAQGSGRRAAG